MTLEYPAKIILAWTQAIGGNAEIRDWLIKNGYPELGLFVFALHNQEEARKWLMDNEHPHLMALIRGAEGDPNAIFWLRKYKMDILEKVAMVADNDDEAVLWLVQKGHKDFADLGIKMRMVKNDIEAGNNDVHKISNQ